MNSTKISIYLIVEGCPIKEVVKSGVKSKDLGEYILYYEQNQNYTPSWVDTFFNGLDEVRDLFKASTYSAVLLYTIGVGEERNRIFAVTFGYGRLLIKPEVIEERFGLTTVLKTVDPKQFRSVDMNSLDVNSLSWRVQSSLLTKIDVFQIDKDKDLIKSVTGKASSNWYKSSISGSSSLSITTSEKYNSMDQLFKEIYREYETGRYPQELEWVDKIKQVTNKDEIDSLIEKFLVKLNSEAPGNIQFSVPDIIEWSASDRFLIDKVGLFDDISLNIIKERCTENFTKDFLISNHLYLIDETGKKKSSWPFYKCFTAELIGDGDNYYFAEGVWYCIDRGFVGEIESFYDGIRTSNLSFPEFDTKDEGDYNEKVQRQSQQQYILLDKKLVQLGGSSIEVCDLFSKDKHFIHVKHSTGSALLSHLFNQGLVSAESMLDSGFRAEVNKKLSTDFKIPDSYNTSDYEIVYVIAMPSIVKPCRPNIPFFSKVAFRNVVRRITGYGYKVSILGIPYTYRYEIPTEFEIEGWKIHLKLKEKDTRKVLLGFEPLPEKEADVSVRQSADWKSIKNSIKSRIRKENYK